MSRLDLQRIRMEAMIGAAIGLIVLLLGLFAPWATGIWELSGLFQLFADYQLVLIGWGSVTSIAGFALLWVVNRKFGDVAEE